MSSKDEYDRAQIDWWESNAYYQEKRIEDDIDRVEQLERFRRAYFAE